MMYGELKIGGVRAGRRVAGGRGVGDRQTL